MSYRTWLPKMFLPPLLASLAASAVVAAEPFCEQTVLFQAGEGGYELYRIPGVVATPSGVVLVSCEARKTAKGDWGDIDLYLRRSTDGGRSWSAPRLLVDGDGRGFAPNPLAAAQQLSGPDQITVNNPVAIVDARPGVIHLLYCIEYARCFYLRSEDDGATFSEPVEITAAFEGFRPRYDWKVLATGPGHGIQLRTGRLIVPVWLSTGTGGHAHRPSVNSTIFSDDGGRTWQSGEIIAGPEQPANPSETIAVELSDGSVMVNFRHESPERRRGVSVSADGATAWSPVRFDPALPEPICMASLVRGPQIPGADRPTLLFSNPYNAESRERRNVSIQVSFDDGRTWTKRRTLEAGPSGYSDLAVGPDGTIYCFYERGGAQYGPRTLTLARFNVEWVLAE